MDLLDNGTTVDCHPPRCVIISYVGGALVFNVTSFTSYEATEAATSVNATVLKIDSPDPVNESGILNYTITVNLSGGFMYNTTVGETYPPNVSFLSSEPAPSSGNDTFTIGDLFTGDVFVVNVSVLVGSGMVPGTVLHNLANVTFNNLTGGLEAFNATADTTVVSCPFNVMTSSVLIADISCPATAVNITANNVNLDCAGYTVTFSNSASGQGINAVNRSNVTIRNCNVVLGNTGVSGVDGILFGNTTNSSLRDTNVSVLGSGSARGINVQASSVNVTVLRVNASAESGIGLLVRSSSNMTVADSVAASNGSSAALNLSSVSNSVLQNTTGSGFNGSGIYLDTVTNVIVVNNTAVALSPIASVIGMLATFPTGSTIRDNVGSARLRGIMLANLASTNVTNNTAVAVTETGFLMSSGSGSRIVNNSGVGPNGFNIFIGTSAIVGNRGVGNTLSTGFTVSGSSLDVANNSGVSDTGSGMSFGLTNSNVSGNNATSTSGKAMVFAGASTNNTVSGNVVQGGTNVGLELQQASNDNLLINNVVSSNGSTAIGIEQSNNTRIVNNSVSTGGGSGILFNGASNNTAEGNNATTVSGAGLRIASAAQNSVVNLTVSSGSGQGILFTQANNTRVYNLTVTSNTGTLISFSSDNDNNALDGSLLRTNGTWFSASSTTTNTNLSNTTFESLSGSIRVAGLVAVPSGASAPVAKLNTSLNHSFLNSTNLSFLNTSAQITLNGLGFVDPRPAVDFDDDGVFAECDAPQCVEVSFAGGVYVFNVSSFTSYAAQENVTFTINLSVDKFDSPDPVPRGSQLSYQIQINNTGNASALNVTLVETYPPNVSFVSSQPVPSSGNNTFSVGNLSPSSSFLVNITVDVGASVPNGTLLNNSIQVIFTNSSGVNSTVNDSELTTVLGAPVIVSIKSDSPDPVVKGGVLNYTIAVNNTGDDTAFNVTLSEVYPAGVSLVSAQPTPIGNSTFAIGTLAPGALFLVNISVTVGSNVANGTILNNSVNLSFRNASGGQAVASDSELTTVLGFPSVTVTKTDTPDPVNNGSTLSYTITITNLGDDTAFNVTVTEGYDANVTFNGSSPAPSAGNNTFVVGNLSPGQSTTINITVNVSVAAAGVLNNTVNVSSENSSGDVSLASAFAETTVTVVAPVPVPAGGGGSGGGGGAAFTRNTPITRNESVNAPQPVSFPFAQFPATAREQPSPAVREPSSSSQSAGSEQLTVDRELSTSSDEQHSSVAGRAWSFADLKSKFSLPKFGLPSVPDWYKTVFAAVLGSLVMLLLLGVISRGLAHQAERRQVRQQAFIMSARPVLPRQPRFSGVGRLLKDTLPVLPKQASSVPVRSSGSADLDHINAELDALKKDLSRLKYRVHHTQRKGKGKNV